MGKKHWVIILSRRVSKRKYYEKEKEAKSASEMNLLQGQPEISQCLQLATCNRQIFLGLTDFWTPIRVNGDYSNSNQDLRQYQEFRIL